MKKILKTKSRKKNNLLINGFTLIELLAVIIILAIVALIAVPIVLNVVNDSKESSKKSILALYSNGITNQLTESYLTNGGKYSKTIDLNDDNLDKSVTCEEVHYTKDSKVLLGNCTIKGHSGSYWYVNGEISTEKPDNFEYLKYALLSSTETVLYSDNSGANKPILFDNMIPVIYKDNNWVYVDITEKWYDYDNKEWANAVVLNNGITKNVGDTIDVDTEVSLMFVWIPRYKYTIFNGNNGSVDEQEINIVFESGVVKTGTVTCTTETSGGSTTYSEVCTDSITESIINGTSTYTHPAFTLGTQELTGIWVGKFENGTIDTTCNNNQNKAACNNVLSVAIKPNVQSWRMVSILNSYTSILNIPDDYEMNVDTHMMKSMEWGAVAYLTYSKYGTCTEIAKNDSSDYYTGRSQGVTPLTSDYSPNGTYTYEKPEGRLASTTGNIYGIYDMSGGAYEITMGNMVNSNNQFYSSDAGFDSDLLSKYYDAYTYDSSNTTHSRGRLGDATKETLKDYEGNVGGWYGSGANFLRNNFSWFMRGPVYASSVEGIFSFGGFTGSPDVNFAATRTVLVAK